MAAITSFSPASLETDRAMPTTLLSSSIDVGWTSVLLQRHRVDSSRAALPFDTQPTPDQQIVVLTRGQLELEARDSARWYRALYGLGSAGMTPHDRSCHIRWNDRGAGGPSETAHLYIPQSFFDEAADDYRKHGLVHREPASCSLVFHDPLIAQAVFSLLDAMASGAPNLYAERLTRWLTTHLLSAQSSWIRQGSEDRSPGVIEDRRLARVIEYMSAHFADSLSLDRLAREAGVSKFHFVRLFRQRMRLTPHAYLVQLRMDSARRLLMTTGLSVSQIAAACGYDNAAHFGTAFARRFQSSPTRFRAQEGR